MEWKQRGGLTRPGDNKTKRRRTKLSATANKAQRREAGGRIGCSGGGGEGVLMMPFICRGGELRGRGRVERRPSMASVADSFKALR
jgi:hypothetical protein